MICMFKINLMKFFVIHFTLKMNNNIIIYLIIIFIIDFINCFYHIDAFIADLNRFEIVSLTKTAGLS